MKIFLGILIAMQGLLIGFCLHQFINGGASNALFYVFLNFAFMLVNFNTIRKINEIEEFDKKLEELEKKLEEQLEEQLEKELNNG